MHLQSSREEEKARIAREIHDDMGGRPVRAQGSYTASQSYPFDGKVALTPGINVTSEE